MNGDNMNGLTRDDMLRELELLPIWTLRHLLPQAAKVHEKPAPAIVEEVQAVVLAQVENEVQHVTGIQPVHEAQAIAEAQVTVILEESVIEVEPIQLVQQAQQTDPAKPLRALPSEDGAYLFLMEPTHALSNADAELLLQNMLRAMRVTCRTEIQNTPDQIFAQHAPKLIICLGAEAAETLLQQTHTMAEWRSQQPLSFRDMPLVVTYKPEHLLQHHQDKALAWQDLCMAMQLLQDL